jgi:stage II sporulation protein D
LTKALPALLLLALLPLGCSKMGMTPNPGGGAPAKGGTSSWGEAPLGTAVRTLDVDFARAFDEEGTPHRDSAAPGRRSLPLPAYSLRHPPIKTQTRPVRVLLKRGIREAVFYSAASARVFTPDGAVSFRGRMHIDASYNLPNNKVLATAGNVKKELRLPCTLMVFSASNLLELSENSYRGAIIAAPDSNGAVTLINVLHVEDYLRGVVPLEIGSLSESELEALKAQTVAARSYTYKRMLQNAGKLFDVASTVADQVYGGANAEAAAPDMAIRATRDIIIAYNDEIADAYYHSACGGQTAAPEDVWGGTAAPYLRSRDDLDKSGKAYCARNPAFRWTETWSMSQLSNIIRLHAGEGGMDPPYRGGALRRIEARGRYTCGRVKQAVIVTSAGEHVMSGEKARFVLRRGNTAQQLLRSSNFNSASIANGEITITGTGYGHGIGMCQTGAIARARAGENFEQILRAYYTDIALRTVAEP